MTSTTVAVPAAVSRLRELALSAAWAASVRAAAKLKLADAIGDEPSTVEDLAAAVRADPEALRRLLRVLTCHGIFAETGDGRFAHTDTSMLLREDAPRSLRYTSLWATEPWTWELWPHLDEAVRSGENVFAGLYGKAFFEYLHTDAPESAQVFDRAMSQASQLAARAIADTLDLTDVATVADIAGGQGQVLITLLERKPTLRGVLLELPSVVSNSDPRLWPDGEFGPRVQLVAGDCRREVPVRADLYILKNVLEWDDESTVTTLHNVAAAGRPGARVVVIENFVDDSPETKFTTAMDLLLLLNVGGKKHTRDGILSLIVQAGLIVQNVSPLNSYLHMITSMISPSVSVPKH